MSSEYFPVHAHGVFSSMDGMNSVEQIVSRVSELGQAGLALTDHGTMAGTVQAYKACQKAGVALFPGLEAYLVRDVTDPDTKGNRYHLGLMALDLKGYEALTKLSTLSWQADRFYYKPLVDLSDLAFLHEEGYSDHIAVTTGCFSGMVVQSFLEHGDPTSMIQMLAKWFPNTLYVELQDHGITWKDHGVTDHDIAVALYNSAQALGLPVVWGADSHYIWPHQQKTHDLMKMVCYFGAGEDVQFSGGPYHLLSADEVRQKAGHMMAAVDEGHADLLDRHMLKIPPLDAYKFNVPKLFPDPDRELRRVVAEAIGSQDRSNTPGLLALDGILDERWIRTGSLAQAGRVVDDGEGASGGVRTAGGPDSGRDDSRSRSEPGVHQQGVREPGASGAGDAEGERAAVVADGNALPAMARVHAGQHGVCNQGSAAVQGVQAGVGSSLAGEAKVYFDRLIHELDVISKMGMSNYFLLVREHITEWSRTNGIIVNTRGSANGSLVCYIIGITTVDPIKWNTNFERFLSLDRMKPPDIDVDVDFQGRQRVIEHLRSVFPTMVQVGTYQQIGFGKNKDGSQDSESGSVMVQYMAAMRKKDPAFDGKVRKEHWDPLNDLVKTPVYRAMGTNAAGFILPGDGYPISKYLPLARISSSDTTVTQFNKNDVESMGYLKIDVLGLRALQTLNNTLVLIGRQPNEWDWIPDDDKAATELLRKGHSAGVFQYEGFTNRKGAMEMKVKTTLDCILGIALYRPAMINGGQKDQYLANRGKSKARQDRLHPIFDPVVADTAGVPLYQEQIMQMLQTIGMEFKEYNELMTAIKASNGFIADAIGTFNRLMPLFYDLCEDKGLTDEESDDAWHAVVGFTEYGFNRAHSTSYGLMAYRAAYLKAHHQQEFMVSLLSVWSTDKDRTREYTAEARRLGFNIVKADVNESDLGWKVDQHRHNALRKGLVAIPGIGKKAAEAIVAERDANGPYTSIQDFIDRLPARPVSGGSKWKSKQELVGVCRTLYEANAFRSVGSQ